MYVEWVRRLGVYMGDLDFIFIFVLKRSISFQLPQVTVDWNTHSLQSLSSENSTFCFLLSLVVFRYIFNISRDYFHFHTILTVLKPCV